MGPAAAQPRPVRGRQSRSRLLCLPQPLRSAALGAGRGRPHRLHGRQGRGRFRHHRRLHRPPPSRPVGGGGGDGDGRAPDRTHAGRHQRPPPGAGAAGARHDAGEARPRGRPPVVAGDRLRLRQDASAQDAGQPGARHQCQGRSAAARGRRRHRRRAGLRRDRDDDARGLECVGECAGLHRGRGRGPGRGPVPVFHRGGGGAADRAGGPCLLCRDGFRLRHRARLHRRRRHALVQGLPHGGLCLARHQGALHLGRGGRASDGLPREELAALPGGALPVPAAGHGRAGHPERRHRRRTAHRLHGRRRARADGGKPARRLARARMRVGQRHAHQRVRRSASAPRSRLI